ncbi:MAG: 30S ribosomal protein S6 [Rhabdochlamydiaceae bacterium]|nr:30S ribosomal protein S6 [Rhabdochlamydiaceae bacterium]
MAKNQNKGHLYEGMYILSTALTDDACQKLIDKMKNNITEKGGEIHKIFDQGRKKLAYEINKKREGHYFLFYFSVPTEAMEKLWREYRLTEDILRFMTTRTPKVPEKIEFQPLPE